MAEGRVGVNPKGDSGSLTEWENSLCVTISLRLSRSPKYLEKTMSVRLSEVLKYTKGGGQVAAATADANRNRVMVNPAAANEVNLPVDEFQRVEARAAKFRNASDKVPAQAQIVGISSGFEKGGLPRMRWDGPNDTETFYMNVKVLNGDRDSIVPEIWTNLTHGANPRDFEAFPMEFDSQNGDIATYKVTIPVKQQGNFRVTGRISTTGQADNPNWQWAANNNIGDIRFRPRAVANENISEQVVHVGLANANPDGSNISTFRDLMDPTFGKYNIAAIKAAGKNTIRLQPPFAADRWDRAHPYDTLGSPYAATDYFTIDSRYSKDAQEAIASGAVDPSDKEALRNLANAEFWAFVKEAHKQGVQVVLDIALNHMGHNTTVRDLFDDPETGEQVRARNFSQIVINQEQADAVAQRLSQNPTDIGEQLFPEMFLNKNGDPNGARSVIDAIGGGNGEWADTKALNVGMQNYGTVERSSDMTRSVSDWHTRILKFWAQPPSSEPGAPTEGVDGFRLDHATNLSPYFYENSLTQLQAMLPEDKPPLVFITEDFNQGERLRLYGDAMESGWYRNVIAGFKRGNADDIWNVVGSDYFFETLRGGNHDEERISTLFEGNLMASGRYLAMLDLFGGVSTTVMGDEFGEGRKVEFKHIGPVSTLAQARNHQLPAANIDLQQAMKRAGEAKNSDPSLMTSLRTRIYPDSNMPQLLGVARHADDRSVPGTLVIANLANNDRLTNKFWLDDETRSRIDPNAMYEVRDEMSPDQGRNLWPTLRRGQDLLDQGIFVDLMPYQIQALKIEKRGS
jgi:hypothetical protein